nr:hypothetical protein [Streptomyces sp. BE147]
MIRTMSSWCRSIRPRPPRPQVDPAAGRVLKGAVVGGAVDAPHLLVRQGRELVCVREHGQGQQLEHDVGSEAVSVKIVLTTVGIADPRPQRLAVTFRSVATSLSVCSLGAPGPRCRRPDLLMWPAGFARVEAVDCGSPPA